MEYRSGRKSIMNYLDDFLFIAIARLMCNSMIQQFYELCRELNVPIAIEKTEWASTLIVFLGILLDGKRLVLSIPLEKQQKALNLLSELANKKKTTVKKLQVLIGYLNFLTKAIVPGRTLTRRIYAKYATLSKVGSAKPLKPHHHVNLDQEFRFDCKIW